MFPFTWARTMPAHTLLRTRARTFVFIFDIRHHLFTINPISRQIQRNVSQLVNWKDSESRQSTPEEDALLRRSMVCAARYHAPAPTGSSASDSREADLGEDKEPTRHVLLASRSVHPRSGPFTGRRFDKSWHAYRLNVHSTALMKYAGR